MRKRGQILAACLVIAVLAVTMYKNGSTADAGNPVMKRAANHVSKPVTLEEQIEYWIREMAQKEEFAAWKKARWQKYPLGPGQHGWVVIVTGDDEEEVGYLVVHMTPDERYILSEYGLGEYPLFSMHTLYQTLIQWELIPHHLNYESFVLEPPLFFERIYAGVLTTLWRVENPQGAMLFDAKTGEIYPAVDPENDALEPFPDTAGFSPVTSLLAIHLAPFDPFENLFWLTGSGTVLHEETDLLSAVNRQKRIVYTTEILQGEVTLPFAVSGLHRWRSGQKNEIVGVMLDHYGPRVIPYDALKRAGRFAAKPD